jgi:hypothetical protein
MKDERKFSKTPLEKPLSLQFSEPLQMAPEEELVDTEKQPDCNIGAQCTAQGACCAW